MSKSKRFDQWFDLLLKIGRRWSFRGDPLSDPAKLRIRLRNTITAGYKVTAAKIIQTDLDTKRGTVVSFHEDLWQKGQPLPEPCPRALTALRQARYWLQHVALKCDPQIKNEKLKYGRERLAAANKAWAAFKARHPDSEWSKVKS